MYVSSRGTISQHKALSNEKPPPPTPKEKKEEKEEKTIAGEDRGESGMTNSSNLRSQFPM